MSRSYKRPYYTDQQGHSDSPGRKNRANRAVRREKEISNGKQYRKVENPYNIRDWSFHSPRDKKAYRK